MTTSKKRLMEHAFHALSRGERGPFGDAMADDFTWNIIGSTGWSGTYSGRDAVARDLLEPLFAQFADRYTNTAHRFVAEGDYVVVESRGRVTTTRGERYDNEYCYVCRLRDGKLAELTEYCDTALIEAVLRR
jgi:uncharacterized protein